MAKVEEDLFLCEGCCEFKNPGEMLNGAVSCRSCYAGILEAMAVLRRHGCDWLTIVAKDRLPPP
jgi:hypothetical protein